jgi:Ca-activated chloride channel family protein
MNTSKKLLLFFTFITLIGYPLPAVLPGTPLPSGTTQTPALSYGLVFDNSASMYSLSSHIFNVPMLILSKNNPEDETFLIRFTDSERIETVQDFTQDKSVLIKSAEEGFYLERGATALYDAIYLSAEHLSDKAMVGPSRRQALVLITDGDERSSYYSQRKLFKLLREKKTKVYVIGVTELIKTEMKEKSYRKAKDFLNKLALETGGHVYFPVTKEEVIGDANEILDFIRK